MQISITDKIGIELEEYNNKFALASTYTGSDGVGRKEWCKKQMGRDKYADKASPIKVFLGDRETAIKALKDILEAIGGAQEVPF